MTDVSTLLELSHFNLSAPTSEVFFLRSHFKTKES